MLKSREEVLRMRLGAVKEMATKVGDVYKVKILGAEVPKSLINAFVSKAKKERDLDPRENWSDSDLAELFVKYVLDTYLNIDSIPVESIMGEKIENVQGNAQQTPPVQMPGAQTPAQVVAEPVPTPSTANVQNEPALNTAEETKVASIPASLQIETVVFTLANLDVDDVAVQEKIMRAIPVERGTYKYSADGYNENVRGNKTLVESLFKDKKENFDAVYKLLVENNYLDAPVETKVADPVLGPNGDPIPAQPVEELFGFGKKVVNLDSASPSKDAQEFVSTRKNLLPGYYAQFMQKMGMDQPTADKAIMAVYDFAKGIPLLNKYELSYDAATKSLTINPNKAGASLFSSGTNAAG